MSSSIIQLLPDHLANQIAAGEVVQRPASIVKELMENAIDAGATEVSLHLLDAGKNLIKVTDNGSGMSDTDARMCLERHATSKIRLSEDLFKIGTLGFRGEALASIAAVSKMEIKSRTAADEMGTKVVVEGSKIITHEPVAFQQGTQITVQHLFFNVPARKNFLKSNQVELRHISDAFIRIAMAYPDIKFVFYNHKDELYFLNKSNLKQRIINVLGKKFQGGLVPLHQETDLIQINGFLGKPELAKKSRGDQFFFINNRFIKSPYFNHAVTNAYEELLPEGYHPFYAIFFTIDPSKVDVNVHPTKTEVKFESEKAIYAILKASIVKALNDHHISPSLDFDKEDDPFRNFSQREEKTSESSSLQFNTPDNSISGFAKSSGSFPSAQPPKPTEQEKNNADQWESLYEVLKKTPGQEEKGAESENSDDWNTDFYRVESTLNNESVTKEEVSKSPPIQIQQKYILSPIRTGVMIINQFHAHYRILYEQYLAQLQNNKSAAQQQLFPEEIHLSPADFRLIGEVLPHMEALGFSLSPQKDNRLLVKAVPAEFQSLKAEKVFEKLLSDHKSNLQVSQLKAEESIARALAKNAAIKSGTPLGVEEMYTLIDQLFACEMPYYTPHQKPVFITISLEELDNKFERVFNR